MWRCPVCETEYSQGLICGNCGYDPSCDYERSRTLCSALPGRAEPVSVRAMRWRQPITAAQRTLVCPRCGGRSFSFLIDELQFLCTDCGGKLPVTLPKDGPASESDPPVKNETAGAPGDTPAPADTDTHTGTPGGKKGPVPPSGPQPPGTEEKTDILCPCCRGSGKTVCFTAFADTKGENHYYASQEFCKLCDGRRYVTKAAGESYEGILVRSHHLRAASRKSGCQFCFGTGVAMCRQFSQTAVPGQTPDIMMQPCPACEGKETRMGAPTIRRRGVATFCCLFPYTGWLAAGHCFYLRKTARGIFELIAFWGGIALASTGVPVLLIWLFLWIQDIVRIRKMPKFFAVN